ncbi:MAG TPA: ABC transporter substrate-binding protein [Solirubrobacterales bacterium]|nr:ABC transporter substrate-binding protein [Solirubrobacterales bacterium]
MAKRLATALTLLAALMALGVAGCGGDDDSESASGDSSTISLAFSTWNGYAGLVIGVESGIFEEEGLDVSYDVIEDPVQRFNAFKAGEFDAVATTPDTFSRNWARAIETVQVLPVDRSLGGDGIVAGTDVTDVAGLEGETVAVSQGSTSQWFLGYVLEDNGLSLDDVEQANLTAADAGAAFAAGRVPVAVTWEPWLTRAEKNPDGHVLVSTEDYPDIITDGVAFSPDYVEENPETVQKFVDAYGKVMDMVESDPDKAFGYASDYLGQSVADIKATLKTVPLLTLEEGAEFYGTADSPGPAYDVFTQSGEFWESIGEADEVANADDAIDPSFINEAVGQS